jgi:hypothetical protein
VPEAPGDERHGQRQSGQQVPRREPEPEHRRRKKGRHQHLRSERGGAYARRELDLTHSRYRPRDAFAARVPQPPEAGERQREHRRPAQQPVVAVHEQSNEAVGALEISAGKGRVRGGLALDVGGVRRRPAVDGLVDPHVERHREQRELDRAHRERPVPRPPQRACGEDSDHHARGHELRAEPRKCAQEQVADARLQARDPRVQPHCKERRPDQRRRRGQLRVDRAAICQERRAQPDRERRAERPRVGSHPQRELVGQRERQRRDRRQEQLDRVCAAECERRRDQQREADAVWLVQPPVGLVPVRPELVRVVLLVRAGRVLVAHVDVAVVHQRLRGKEVVRLVAAVVRAPERVQPERGGVDAEQQQPEGEGATHRAPHPSHG